MNTSCKTKISLLVYLSIALIFSGCFPAPTARSAATSGSLTTEAGIVVDFGYQSSDSSIFPVASLTKAINVRVYRDVEESITGYKTFDFDYTNKANPLLEKELFQQLGKALQAKGLIRVKENPQILISMDFFIGKKEQYTPPNTVTSTKLQSVWNTGMIGWNVGGFSSQVPVTSSVTQPGYTTVSYYTNIRLNFMNYAKLTGEVKPQIPPLIWIGEAENNGDDPDIRTIAQPIFNELAGEFPSPSGKASTHFVRCLRYGSFGLGFEKSNWKLIRYVEPYSPAAKQGIKPGDLLVRINGKTASNWPSVDGFWMPKTESRYRDGDPYFKYVLSNRGDTTVDVVIRSAETGKTVTLTMKPQSVERYLEVTNTGIPIQNAK
jgi:hypothetical protein